MTAVSLGSRDMSTMYARDGLGCHELDVSLNDDLDSEQNSTLAREFHCEYQVHDILFGRWQFKEIFLRTRTIVSPYALCAAAGMPVKAHYHSPAVFCAGAGIRRSRHDP